MRKRLTSPMAWLAAAAVYALLLSVAVVLMAVRQPWMGLTLVHDSALDAVVVRAAAGPAAEVPAGTVIVEVSGGGRAMELRGRDLIPEPDGVLETYAIYDEFIRRQDELSRILRSDTVTLRDAEGVERELRPAPARPLGDLPAAFWVQLAVGVLAWLISAAVWVFRRQDAAARLLLLSGWTTALFSPLAGVYSTRELAMDGTLVRWLSDLNFMGGSLFAGALAALLTVYPRRVGPGWLAPLLVGAQAAWFVAQQAGVFESMIFARRMLVMVALVVTFALAAWHWRATRRDPVARAALRWFLLSWLTGTSVFALFILLPQMFGVDTTALQGYAFLLFVPVYAGLAFGILRFRLFGLDEWWARIVTWLALAALLVALDLLFLYQLQLGGGLSLGLALLVCGVLWLPLRGYLAERLLGRTRADPRAGFRAVVDVALSPRAEEREELWLRCLRATFDPLRSERLATGPAGGGPVLEEHGEALVLPSAGELGAVRLEHARGGRALFSPRDAATAAELLDLLRHVMESRDAYERGVRVERGRIARDIHDNIGARLLGALHSREETRREEALRGALSDLRGIINDTTNPDLSPEEALADLRYESAERLEAAGVALSWKIETGDAVRFSPRLAHALRPMIREAITNIVKHARAAEVRVSIRPAEGGVAVAVEDDGAGFDPGRVRRGHGLTSLESRVAELGGRIAWSAGAGGRGARMDIWFPATLLHATS
jgi:signal transduction histidine kinase